MTPSDATLLANGRLPSQVWCLVCAESIIIREAFVCVCVSLLSYIFCLHLFEIVDKSSLMQNMCFHWDSLFFFFFFKRELIVKKWELKIWKKIIKWTFKKAVNMCCCFLDVIKQTSRHFMWYPLLYFEIGIRVQNLMAVWMCLCKSLWSGYLRCHPHTASLNHQSDVTRFPFVTH